MNFLFDVRPQSPEELTDQVAAALRARGELVSRETFPRMWKVTDRINESNRRSNRKPRSSGWKKGRSILCLLLGVFLFVPGVMKPGELPGPLVMGALSILVGIYGLIPKRKQKKAFADRHEEAAQKLLTDRAALTMDLCRAVFDDHGMAVTDGRDTDQIPYSRFECVIGTRDLFLLVFDERAMLLWKSEMTEGDPAEFGGALALQGVKYHNI